MITLSANALYKSYKGREVLSGATLAIQRGEIVGLLGPNGAGKTTCFNILVGLVRADSGHVLINGEDISRKPIHQRAKLGIGYLPQEASVFRKLTVEQNIEAILELNSKLSKADRKAKTNQLLEEFGLTHLRHNMGASLSGGERRRVEIARSIANDPSFILLDEPFAGIDPISIIDIKQIINQLQSRGIGVLITDHNVRETLDICERAYIVSEGKILTEGTPEAIVNNQTVRSIYLGDKFKIN